ncbi:kinase-like domain-containing protein [Rhizophagus irregularis DAOM 181602=DAOM 197198]|nr:kinase-like domain-containing protein [Rhizophagus irregularis DAOM 181602=DAOM 197198]
MYSENNSCDFLTVKIYKDDKDKKRYVDFNNAKTSLNQLYIEHLRDHVCSIKGVDDSDKSNLKLWKVIGVKIPSSPTPLTFQTKLEDRTSDFLNLLLCPFDTEIDCTNVEQFLSAKLPLKLPCFPGLVMGYTDVIEDTFSSSIYSSRLSLIVGEVMSASFKQISGGEARTLGNIDVHIRKIIELAQEYVENCSDLDLDRSKTINSTTTTTEHPRSRPDMTIYYKNVLFMMGEEKDLDDRLEAAERQLDGYLTFGIHLPLALQHTINAIRIIRTWDLKQYIRRPEIKLYEVIQRRNGTTVTINPKKIIISYLNQNIMQDGYI